MAFSDDSFLIAGQVASENRKFKPFTAIFDRSGRMVSRLSFKSDKKMVEQPTEPTEGALPAIESGNVAASDDGNAYIMRRLKTTLVSVVSPSGQLLRTFAITPPENYDPIAMRVANGRLIFTFQNGKQRNVEILYGRYSTINGEAWAIYKPGKDIRGIFGCYENDQFTFLGVSDSKRVIVKSRP